VLKEGLFLHVIFSQLGIGSKNIGKILDTLEENKKSIAQK
jgi:hypothetical protein